MTPSVADEREVRLNMSWTSKIANATVLRRGRRPRTLFELMRRGQLRPKGISRANMFYVRLHAAQMVRIYKRYDRIEMTPEERESFEAEVLRHKMRPLSENFALLTLDVKRVEGKVDQVLDILKVRLPSQP